MASAHTMGSNLECLSEERSVGIPRFLIGARIVEISRCNFSTWTPAGIRVGVRRMAGAFSDGTSGHIGP